jgi:predicted nuclease with TOPRIM domain
MLGEGSRAQEELEELRYRMAELEEHGPAGSNHDLIARVAELEERLDFAERLLASEDKRAKLPEPTDEVSAETTQE